MRKEGDSFLTTLALAAILIYLVLAAQFESFRDPLIILMGSVPLGLTGALAVTFLGKTTINAYSYVGLVTLVGLVCKNGILIVEFANKLQERGLDKFHAIIEAAATRLRPILMTSVATVAGHTPLILAQGPGAGARNSIGWVLVTGMIIGTCFNAVCFTGRLSSDCQGPHERSGTPWRFRQDPGRKKTASCACIMVPDCL